MSGDERLRDLQRRAYGPGGGLSEAESEELAALQRRDVPALLQRRDVPALPPVERLEPRAAQQLTEERPRVSSADGDREGALSEPAASVEPPAGADRSRRRYLAPAIAAACALLIGLGLGWALFGRGTAPAMSEQQQDEWAEFAASGRYDQGSIRVVGEKSGITAWYATQDGATKECLMLTPSPQTSIACALVPDPDDEAPEFWEQPSTRVELGDSSSTVVEAFLVRDVRGEPVAVMQEWTEQISDWTKMFQGTALENARVLVDSGVDGNLLQIVGYDGDVPVWLTQDGESCLYVVTAEQSIGRACGPMTDGKMDLEMSGTVYTLRTNAYGTTLTITRGDVSPPPAIDDTTGEVTD